MDRNVFNDFVKMDYLRYRVAAHSQSPRDGGQFPDSFPLFSIQHIRCFLSHLGAASFIRHTRITVLWEQRSGFLTDPDRIERRLDYGFLKIEFQRR
jgi:hypothetical protein